MPEVTRRRALVLGAGAVGAGAAALSLRPESAAPTAKAHRMTPVITPLLRSQFLPAVGSLLLARRAGAAHRLRLVKILDVPGAASGEHAFNLIFRQAHGETVAEGIYEVSGTRLAGSSLFLSPVDVARAGHVQALVNSPR